MKGLTINKRKIWYSQFTGTTANVDANGNRTGEVTRNYSNPVMLKASVSASRGSADLELFGVNLNYNKTVIVDNTTCPITETTILWVDTDPQIDNSGKATAPHDYVVRSVAKSLNNIAYAISKVNVQ